MFITFTDKLFLTLQKKYLKPLFKFILIFSLGFCFVQARSQTDSTKIDTVIKTEYNKTKDIRFDENRLLYRKEYSGGIILHTRGFGANYRKTTNLNARQKYYLNYEFIVIKHPKEYKISSFDRNANSYVYGKKMH